MSDFPWSCKQFLNCFILYIYFILVDRKLSAVALLAFLSFHRETFLSPRRENKKRADARGETGGRKEFFGIDKNFFALNIFCSGVRWMRDEREEDGMLADFPWSDEDWKVFWWAKLRVAAWGDGYTDNFRLRIAAGRRNICGLLRKLRRRVLSRSLSGKLGNLRAFVEMNFRMFNIRVD